MSPNDITTILTRLSSIDTKLDQHGEELKKIRKETEKTNGRVTALESRELEDRARLDERQSIEQKYHDRTVRWSGPIIAVLMTAAAAAVIALLNLDKL